VPLCETVLVKVCHTHTWWFGSADTLKGDTSCSFSASYCLYVLVSSSCSRALMVNKKLCFFHWLSGYPCNLPLPETRRYCAPVSLRASKEQSSKATDWFARKGELHLCKGSQAMGGDTQMEGAVFFSNEHACDIEGRRRRSIWVACRITWFWSHKKLTLVILLHSLWVGKHPDTQIYM